MFHSRKEAFSKNNISRRMRKENVHKNVSVTLEIKMQRSWAISKLLWPLFQNNFSRTENVSCENELDFMKVNGFAGRRR